MADTDACLVVLAGPTAVGKGTVVGRAREIAPDLWTSVSATTRPPRPGEIEGVHYRFVDDATFDAMIERGEFLEWAVVHNAYRYGTPSEPVRRIAAAGRPALLEIDLAGARQVRAAVPDALFVFLAPPSFETLVERLALRGTESADERRRRLGTARDEMAAESEFDVTIVNTDIDQAATELVDLISHGRRIRPHQSTSEAT